MSNMLRVVFRMLDKAGLAFIEPRREDGHGSHTGNPTYDYITNWPNADQPLPITGVVETISAPEVELSRVNQTVTLAGATPLHSPAPGKAIRIKRLQALNDPFASSSTKITIKLGDAVAYESWAISFSGVITGPTDGALSVVLSNAGNVTVNVFYEEVLL